MPFFCVGGRDPWTVTPGSWADVTSKIKQCSLRAPLSSKFVSEENGVVVSGQDRNGEPAFKMKQAFLQSF